MWHEISSDVISGIPITLTYWPLSNTAIAFDSRFDGKILDFGVTGKLRHSDLIMYDRKTESWWQKFVGKAIIGERTGTRLKRLPVRIIPFAECCEGYPDGLVLVPNYPHHIYGKNPCEGYDMIFRPPYTGEVITVLFPALAYVVDIEGDAWPLKQVRDAGRIDF
jgi:hypothetical protein